MYLRPDAHQVMTAAEDVRPAQLQRRVLGEIEGKDPAEAVLVPHIGVVVERILVLEHKQSVKIYPRYSSA